MKYNPIDFLQAIGEKDYESVVKMLALGYSPSLLGKCGNTPLSNAAEVGSIEILELLLNNGADINESITYKSDVDGRVKENYSPLMFAYDLDVIKFMVSNGAKVNHQEANGFTKLMLNASIADDEYISINRLLIELGADKDIALSSYNGKTGTYRAYDIAVDKEAYIVKLNTKSGNKKLEIAIEKINEMKTLLE